MRVPLLLATLLLLAPDAPAAVPGIHDFGDAPEGLVLPGVLDRPAAFPTCIVPGPVGTVESVCLPRGTPPGPAGFVHHVSSPLGDYWLGCGSDPLAGLGGIDSESDGKSSAGPGTSECNPVQSTDCALPEGYGQDECWNDEDAGLQEPFVMLCTPGQTLGFRATNAGASRTVYLNLLLDANADGDWNDNGPCAASSPLCVIPCPAPDGCAHEWAVKNAPVTLPEGCSWVRTPPFDVGPVPERRVWLRLTLTDGPVGDDFPWAGSAARPGGTVAGGETEDYLVVLLAPDPVTPSSWGSLKLRYR